MITTKREPVKPGEMLREEFLKPLGLTQEMLATAMGVQRRRVNEIVGGKRGVTAETAVKLACALDTSPQFWLNLQVNHDIWSVLNSHERKARIDKVKPLHKAVA